MQLQVPIDRRGRTITQTVNTVGGVLMRICELVEAGAMAGWPPGPDTARALEILRDLHVVSEELDPHRYGRVNSITELVSYVTPARAQQTIAFFLAKVDEQSGIDVESEEVFTRGTFGFPGGAGRVRLTRTVGASAAGTLRGRALFLTRETVEGMPADALAALVGRLNDLDSNGVVELRFRLRPGSVWSGTS